MVTVGDIKIINRRKESGKPADGFAAVDNPDRVCNSVVGHKVINRLVRSLPTLNDCGNFAFGAVGEENRTCVGVAVINMVDSVRLLVRSCQLMLFDDAVNIIVNRNTADKTRLASAVHYLTVNIEIIVFVLLADSVADKLIEIFSCFEINLLRIEVGSFGQIYFSLVNMKK